MKKGTISTVHVPVIINHLDNSESLLNFPKEIAFHFVFIFNN